VGAFIWSIGLAYGGYMLGSKWEVLRTFMRPFDIPILILIALGVGYYLFRQYKHLKEED
jgi:membrane protein DedA with SNARE-associated domain